MESKRARKAKLNVWDLEVFGRNTDFIVKVKGENTNGTLFEIEMTICDWGIVYFNNQIAKLYRQRIERANKNFANFKDSVNNET